MSFLAPLFLVGLLGLAIPVLIHLTRHERGKPIQFPSLMFLERIPFQEADQEERRKKAQLPHPHGPLTDRLYIKQFEAETNSDVGFLVDVSASMAYGSGEVTKVDYARFLTASLAYFSARQRDRVGLYAFDHDVVEYVRQLQADAVAAGEIPPLPALSGTPAAGGEGL